LTTSEQSLQQAQTQFAQRQPLVAEHRYVQALRQRGQNLQRVMVALARQWPGGVLIQELRLQADALQLQGRTDSSQALAKGLQALSVGVVWQQAPSLQTLERLPSDQQGLRFVAQGRWPNIEFPALSADNSGPAKTAPSKSALANVSTAAKE
jgi:Tfp pilus assembly protein PilN